MRGQLCRGHVWELTADESRHIRSSLGLSSDLGERDDQNDAYRDEKGCLTARKIT